MLGSLDVLEEKRPKIICIDELDKMPRQFQEKLLNFMENGHIKVDQMRKQYDFKIKGAKVFAACNEITRLSRPLQSRFRCLQLPPYSEEQFLEVSAEVLPKLKIAHVIGKAVWDQRGDIRDVISIGKLVRKDDGPEEVEQILGTIIKYSTNNYRSNSISGAGSEN
jgi:MoxR-like ATPase